ncbi:uncharacterized protein [Parasteatoda tepidariorum]|uniref:uncharacterized protein n=1 Tax=Parasteatoda tepidariorum TaxID=114398 RepID=UPI0039BC6D6B
MAGDQYHISVRQIYETESKLCHELKLASHTKGDINVDIFHCDETVTDDELPMDLIFSGVTVEDHDIKAIEDSLPIITYLAGYCSHAASKKTKCAECRQLLIVDKDLVSENYFNLIEEKDRGGLMFPSEVVFNAVIHTYIVVQKLISKKYEETFMKATSQRNVVTNIVEDILVAKDSFLCFDTCLKGHDLLPLIKIILKAATNGLLNNYCKVKNDNLKVKKIPNITVVAKNKRKLETYSKSSIKKTQDEAKM